jgi:hypothetical protein
VFLNSDLVLVRNEVLLLAEGMAPGFNSTTTGGQFSGQPWGVIFSPYTWNLQGKFRYLRWSSLGGIELPFFFFCDCES